MHDNKTSVKFDCKFNSVLITNNLKDNNQDDTDSNSCSSNELDKENEISNPINCEKKFQDQDIDQNEFTMTLDNQNRKKILYNTIDKKKSTVE